MAEKSWRTWHNEIVEFDRTPALSFTPRRTGARDLEEEGWGGGMGGDHMYSLKGMACIPTHLFFPYPCSMSVVRHFRRLP